MVFFNCYLAVSWPTLDHSLGDSFTNLKLIIAFQRFRPGHCEPRNKVGSLSLAEHLLGLELGMFRFYLLKYMENLRRIRRGGSVFCCIYTESMSQSAV